MGLIQQKSAGRSISSSPVPRKQPSGMTRCLGSHSALSRSIVLKVRHCSKARTLSLCVKAWGITCPDLVTGTQIASAFCRICPLVLCGADSMAYNLKLVAISEGVPHRTAQKLPGVTKVRSRPNVLVPPIVESCSGAVSNSLKRSNSWRSTVI